MELRSKPIELARGLVGILCAPQADAKVPAVLMLHGFASHKNEVGDLFKHLAQQLAIDGIASLRFDFGGWGDSAGDMADTTIMSLHEDALAGLQFLSRHKLVDQARLGLLGFSLGAGIALRIAGEPENKIKSLVMWSGTGDFEQDLRHSLGDAAFETASREGEVAIDLGWRRVRLKRAFFESLAGYDLYSSVRNYHGAFFIIAGTEDFSAQYLPFFYRNAAGPIKDRLLIAGADHIFNVLDEASRHAARVVRATRLWYTKSLQTNNS